MLHNLPVITTIIPTFRRPESLKHAINSVLNQTYPHFQVCVYDNASGDSTADLVAAFARKDPRVKYHCHSENIGAAENFQFGLSQVKTPYFSFLSDDDLLLPEFYATALSGFEKYPDAAYSAGAVVDMDEQGRMIQVVSWDWPDQEYYPPSEGLLQMIGKYSNWTGALFQTKIVEQIGPIDLSLKAIDVDFSFRIAARFPIVISKKPCAVFRQHPLSYSGSRGIKIYWPGWQQMIFKMRDDPHLSSAVKSQVVQMLQRDLKNALGMLAVRAVEKRKFDEALDALALYREQGDSGLRVFLAASLALCRRSDLITQLFILLLNLRRFLKRSLRRNRFQREYADLLKNISGTHAID